jgi:hypothetical protein
MLWVHPCCQAAAILLGIYVFYLGWSRFASVSLGRRAPFLWKRHVALGKGALYLWIYGAAVGEAAAWVQWRALGVTGGHFWLGLAITAFALFGYWSGVRMDTHKKQRKVMPFLHGGNNLLLLLLSLLSAFTGIQVILTMFPG